MSGHITHQAVTRFLKTALECSIYVQPTDPGLTYAELVDAAKRAEFHDGEIYDAIPYATRLGFGRADDRILPDENDVVQLMFFGISEKPDYRNRAAIHFVFEQLRAVARSQGAAQAKIERSVLAARGLDEGFSALDIQIAIAILLLNKVLADKDSIIGFAPGKESYGSPGDDTNWRSPDGAQRPIRKEARARAFPIVKDIIERRTDGRPLAAEPLDAFAEQLGKLGYGAFRMWWTQLVSEVQHTSAQVSPVSITVLSAALVEGALSFVVKHGRSLNLGVFASTDFDKSSSSWQLRDLVRSAAFNKETPILDRVTVQRAESLIQSRQRIHAGRMLADFPNGVPDLRPEEARDAKDTAERVVRRILDWLQQHPPV